MESLRVLALGDAHFKTNNVVEVDIFLTKLKLYLEEHQADIDVIINLGDTLDEHSRLNVTPLNKAVEYIKLLSSYKPTFVLVGNHDDQCNSIYLTSDHWLNCLKGWSNVTVVDNVIIQTIRGQKIVLCPYVPDGLFVQALNTKKGEWEDARCIFSHITIKGAQMGTMIAKDADEWPPSYPFLISGHIHLSHWLGPNMYYTGSILQVSIDESPDKHIALVNISSNKVAISEIDLELPKKRIFDVSIKELCDDNYVLPSEANTKYVLYVSGNYEDFKAFIKSSVYKSLTKLPQIYRGQKGIKFKQRKLEIKEDRRKIRELKDCKLKHFNQLLLDSIEKEQDQLLYSFYRHMVHKDDEDLSTMLADILVIAKRTI